MFKVGEMPNSFEEIENDLENVDRVKYAQDIADKSITIVKDSKKVLPLKKEDIDSLMNPIEFVGRAPAQTEEFIATEIDPILNEYKNDLGRKTELKV